MTKKYTPPGGWAAQRKRQILWFLAMFLFFGVMGGWLHHQFAEIWRIDRETQRLRAEARALDDEHERARRLREAFLRHLRDQQEEQQTREAAQRYQNAWANQFLVPDDVPQVPIDEQAVIADWRRNQMPRIIDVMQNPDGLLAVRGFAGFEDELRPWRMTYDCERPWS